MISAEKAREETNKINKTDVTVQKIIDELDTKIKETIVEGEYCVHFVAEMNEHIRKGITICLNEAGYSLSIYSSFDDMTSVTIEW